MSKNFMIDGKVVLFESDVNYEEGNKRTMKAMRDKLGKLSKVGFYSMHDDDEERLYYFPKDMNVLDAVVMIRNMPHCEEDKEYDLGFDDCEITLLGYNDEYILLNIETY